MARRHIEMPQNLLSKLPPWLPIANAVSLGNHGGFSGASLWRIPIPRSAGLLRGSGLSPETFSLESSGQVPKPLLELTHDICLRGYPHAIKFERVQFIHDALRQLCQREIEIVPTPFPMSDGTTIAIADGRNWEIVTWLEGTADYYIRPSTARLASAVVALARIHRAWGDGKSARQRGPAPTVLRRWQRVADLQADGLARIRQAVFGRSDLPHEAQSREELRRFTDPEFLERARHIVSQSEALLPRLARLLDSLCKTEVPLQLCLRDIWHDHVLFQGEAVSGIVDFDAVGTDSVATDLARLVGSLSSGQPDIWRIAFEAYQSHAPLLPSERDLAIQLDQVNVILNPLQWLQWLYVERRSFENWDRVAEQVRRLAMRLSDYEFLSHP